MRETDKKKGRNIPEIIAFYLPQYHVIPENNLWWGEGFTEWVNTKKAVPLFRGHYQPKEPWNDNYYDLMKPGVLEAQMELAQTHGIDGFCFYHYWFHGKKLLEKPVENLLNNSSAGLPYCLCWANEPWTRAWDGLEGEKETIMPQTYGGKKEWEEHFYYLLPFFLDKRYIKLDEKPVFLVYRSQSIPSFQQMIRRWNQLAREQGFSGVYIIQMNTGFGTINEKDIVDSSLDFEPLRSFREIEGRPDEKILHFFRRKLMNMERMMPPLLAVKGYSYDRLYKMIIKKKRKASIKKCYTGVFVNWDNTARKGKDGTVVQSYSPKKFEGYLWQLWSQAAEREDAFIFINAWNEWAEGAYLEPDKRYGFANLNAVRRIKRKVGKQFSCI